MPQRERLLRAIAGLPSEGDIKPMSGHIGLFRLRVGTYRVLDIGNRGDVHK